MLLYLNPNKIVGTLLKFIDTLEEELKIKWDNPHKLRLVIHIGCALERMVTHSGLTYDENSTGKIDTEKFNMVKKAAEIFTTTFQLKLTDDELCYILKMF